MATPAEKRAAFRALHAGGCFVLPNPWDAGSARYLASLGFEALATTSAGAAFSLGLPDAAWAVPAEAMLEHIRSIVEATDLPVNADFESGFAETLDGLAANVRRCIDTGVAGLSIEDLSPQPGTLFDFDTAVRRVRAARRAVDEAGGDVVLTVRSEAFLVGHPDPLNEAIRRLAAFAELGADCLYAPCPAEPELIAALVRAVAPKPVNIIVSAPAALTVRDIAALGARRISTGSVLARAAWGGLKRAAAPLAREGSFAGFADAFAYDALNALFAEGAPRASAGDLSVDPSSARTVGQLPPPDRGRSDGEAVRVGVSSASDADRDPSPERLRRSDPPLLGEGMEPRSDFAEAPIGPEVDSKPAAPPQPTVLEGRLVRLVPVDPNLHLDDLFAQGGGEAHAAIWTYMGGGPFADREAMRGFLAGAATSKDPLFFTILDKASGRAVGMASFLRIEPNQRVIEVGNIWFGPALARTPAATEAMYLMARHAFDDLGYRRYEWKCNALNAPSRRAALRLGFRFEGVFRQHMIVKGRNRDTAWFAMTDEDWPRVRAALEAWLDPGNFDAESRQRRSLAAIRWA